MVNIFGIVPLPKGGVTELPDPVNPYYVVAQNGLYLHKRNMIGKFLIPVPAADLPAAFYGALEKDQTKGLIWREFDPLPGWLMGQTVDFFQQVYNANKTEAEVLITYKEDADPKYRLFVPHQRVSSGSVRSIHDAGNFERGWQLVGSIHSHASMGAFHSGTDTNDASEFPGLHITIGDFHKEQLSFAAMVMVNTTRWDYKIEEVADISQLREHPSPNWWSRYITKDNNPPKGKNLTTKQIQDFVGGVRPPQTYKYSPTAGVYSQTSWQDWDWHDSDWKDWYGKSDIKEPPRPEMWKEGFRWSGQLGGLVRNEFFLKPDKVGTTVTINPIMAIEAFSDRLDELTALAEQFGIELVYELIDHADFSDDPETELTEDDLL
jgi:hypothetical protein